MVKNMIIPRLPESPDFRELRLARKHRFESGFQQSPKAEHAWLSSTCLAIMLPRSGQYIESRTDGPHQANANVYYRCRSTIPARKWNCKCLVARWTRLRSCVFLPELIDIGLGSDLSARKAAQSSNHFSML